MKVKPIHWIVHWRLIKLLQINIKKSSYLDIKVGVPPFIYLISQILHFTGFVTLRSPFIFKFAFWCLYCNFGGHQYIFNKMKHLVSFCSWNTVVQVQSYLYYSKWEVLPYTLEGADYIVFLGIRKAKSVPRLIIYSDEGSDNIVDYCNRNVDHTTKIFD